MQISVHYTRLLFMYLFLSISTTDAQEKKLFGGKKYRMPVQETKDTTGFIPFDRTTTVELWHYKNRMDWWRPTFPEGQKLLVNGYVTIPTEYIVYRKVLNSASRQAWRTALYEEHLCEQQMVTGCYEPRHMLVFYDKNKSTVIACIEVCVTCTGGNLSEGVRGITFCPERSAALRLLINQELDKSKQ